MKVNLNKNKMTKTTTKPSKKVTVKKEVKKEVPWSRMSKKAKRVAIAKDVLKHIKAGSLVPNRGAYFISNEVREAQMEIPYEETVELQGLLQGKTCEVCAKGAIFIADIIKNDDFAVNYWIDIDDGDMMCNRLEGIFERGQLDLIECAFEGGIISDETNILRSHLENTPLADKAEKFFNKYNGDPEKVLTAIMKNIIKNDGTFKP